MVICLIVILLFFVLFKIIFSLDIKFEIENLIINLPKFQKKITNNDSKVSLKIYILKKIKIAEINLKKIDFKDEKVKNKIEKHLGKNNLNLDTIKLLKNIDYIVEKLKLNINVGTEDSAITAICVGILYTVTSIFLNKKVKDLSEIKYEFKPIYNNKNMLDIKLDSIISLKFENIINIIKFLRKGSAYKNVRSSNRKPYAYSNE